jgi:hypothetical protein
VQYMKYKEMLLKSPSPHKLALGRLGALVVLVAILATSLGVGLFYAQSAISASKSNASVSISSIQSDAGSISTIGSSGGSSPSSSSSSSSDDTSTGSTNGLIRLGYESANYVSTGGSSYSLNDSAGAPVVPNIPESDASGHLVFVFSSSFTANSQLFAYYESCSRNLASGVNASCGSKTNLTLSYSQDAQGRLVATTNDLTLPCGSLKMYQGTMMATQFVTVSIGVNTTVIPYVYTYVLYAAC